MTRTSMRFLLLLMTCLLVIAPQAAARDGLSERKIDRLAKRAMEAFHVPGMAIGVIKDGETVYLKGHGVRELGRPEPIDPDTMFKIASNSKAFTTASLAILVDEGLIEWNGAVSDYIPEFRVSDPWVTANLSVTDLLAHRSGLVPHAGDLMLWPDPNRFTRQDVVRGLRYFPLVSDFRDSYNYDNVLYIVAGEIIPRITGQGWEPFVQERIMQPLGMDRCFAGAVPEEEMNNLAAPHGWIDGELGVIERSRIHGDASVYAAAGGVVCSASSMVKWVAMQLGRGTAPDGTEIFSAAQSREMWQTKNTWQVSKRNYDWHRTHFNGYGLGWRLSDVHGYKEVSHTGSLAGMRAWTLMIPEMDLGIVVLSNGSNSAARNAVMQTIKYAYFPVESRNWIETYLALETVPDEAEATDEPELTARTVVEPRPLDEYTGAYSDPWFGDVMVRSNDGVLEFVSSKSPKLSGALEHVTADTFIARWPDRSVGMDAWVSFEFDRKDRLKGIRMNRVFDDPDATIDYFEHIDLKPADGSRDE